MPSEPPPLAYETTVQLRWRDIDMLGHLNQSVYHELLEEARAGMLIELARRLGPAAARGGVVVRHVDIDYHHEVRRDDDPVTAAVRVTRVGGSSIHLHQELRKPDGTVAASGSAVLVAWDPETRGKRQLGDAERAALGGERVASAV